MRGRLLALGLLFVGLAACGPRESLRIGFIGGVSGRVADLGIGGRNGAQMAVDIRNASGGIHGRKIELLVEDDKQDPEIAKHAMTRLIGQKVEAIVGPMTSAMAMAIVPQANETRMLLLSPTVTTTSLSGKDDYFMRVISSTLSYGKVSAEYHVGKKGWRRIAAVYDSRNRAYTEDWLAHYRATVTALGGSIAAAIEFASSDDLHFSELARRILESRPDGVLLLANSVDAALLLQQIRKLDQQVEVAGAEWAATERLIELAGRAAEGYTAAQFFDRESRQPAYAAFRQAYMERFGVEPGFAGLNGFDAANVLLDALERKPAGQSLKEFLAPGSFPGVQSDIVFDAFGDVSRPTFITTVRNGRFVLAQ